MGSACEPSREGEPLGSSSICAVAVAVAVEAFSGHSPGIAVASVFLLSFQRFVALSLCERLRTRALSRSSNRRFCDHVLLRPSRFQKARTASLISAHSSRSSPAKRARILSSSGRSQFGRRHASMSKSRYAPCSSVLRCRVSDRYASVQRVRAGNSAIKEPPRTKDRTRRPFRDRSRTGRRQRDRAGARHRGSTRRSCTR